MSVNADFQEKFNFETASILILEQTQNGLDVLSQIFLGFGARACHRAMTVDEAQRIVLKTSVDLILAEPAAAGDSGLSFVRWLRRSELDPNATAPVVMVSANLSTVAIRNARDAGANFYLAKPISPKILMERITWVIRDNRQFVIADTFSGPDRRFKAEGVPPGVQPRRKTDLKSKLGEAVDANMSQSEIDILLKPQKVVFT